jgi:adenylate cyclase, class 2
MEVQLNREIKTYCPDFTPVRQLLRDLGAAFIGVKEQVDFFYHLPVIGDEEGTQRLKLRIEDGKRQLIYYYDRQETGVRTSRFQLWEAHDLQVKEVLDAALGVRAIVRKQRELWRKENVIFNLDTVRGRRAGLRGRGTGGGRPRRGGPGGGVSSPLGPLPGAPSPAPTRTW